MNVITTFKEKHRKKQMKFEKRVLMEISLEEITKDIQKIFSPFFSTSILYKGDIENLCIDIAIEAYLLGAEFSKFSYYGETIGQVRDRSYTFEQALIEALFDYWLFWKSSNQSSEESIYTGCEAFVNKWWMEGFQNGVKRHRLRLH
ncbi:DUF2521 family protein [Pseudalkalibacillus caeni]|uniref:DUF2521 family protein n=1 Tax=Exobacillus caeni TaxID=2574798 RepID=A0A5R9EW67_9BACL|nr:DUF2521 family protein [Pseudalkalibacillus caeni]TLS35482.1 DUF2521 family protein [Pseudalkalibacillus caeni]